MNPRSEILRALAILGCAGLIVAPVRAQLAASSPFLPVNPVDSATPTAGAPLEFRGLIDLPGEGLKVRIYDPAKKTGAWLRINERDPAYEFVVKQYDASHDTATVEYHGQTLTLAEHEAKVTSSGMAPNVAMAALPMPVGVNPPVALNTSSAVEQQRLEQVAAEVARRRALREQAVQPNGQVIPVTPPIMQPVQQPQNFQQNPNAARGQRGGGRAR